jgi:DNA-binding beta-propeller fold protein YncE
MGLRLLSAALLTALAAAAPAAAAKTPPAGALTQLPGAGGCIVGAGSHARHCATARALAGPGAFVGSHAVAVSPDGRNVYVAAANADAIVVFTRDARTGALTQPDGAAGCIALGGADGCASATTLDGPNSVVVSPDGATVYATARDSNAIVAFARDASTGALTQAGCVATGGGDCAPGRGLRGADAVAVSPDGTSVYVGAFDGNAVASFTRDPATGALTQTGCLATETTEGCTYDMLLGGVEGITVSPDGSSVYAAAALASTIVGYNRAADGTLTPNGCVTASGAPGCGPARSMGGPNAVVVSPDGATLYTTSVVSNALTILSRASNGSLGQLPGPAGCIAALPAAACALARGISRPEGLAISRDGRTVYTASFGGDIAAIDTKSGQLRGRAGCMSTKPSVLCRRGRALLGASSVEVSPDGRNVYVTSYLSGSVTVFRRATG